MLEHFSCFFSLRSRRLSCRTAFRYASAYKKSHIPQAIPRSSPVPKCHCQVIFVASNTFLYLNSFGCYPPIMSAQAATTTTTPPVIQSNFVATWILNTDEATFLNQKAFLASENKQLLQLQLLSRSSEELTYALLLPQRTTQMAGNFDV
jgi:hypothetical protein